MKNKQKLVYGVGTNVLIIKGNEKIYQTWLDMLRRCYDPKYQIKHPTYKGCSVCSDWLTFSKFKEWFDINNRVGMELDKDILIRGNKIYGPQFCRFVPSQINNLLLDHGAKRGLYIQGVLFNSKNQKYRARINKGRDNRNVHIGCYNTEQEAFNAYKIEKELWIKHQADHYFNLGLIGLDIHTALYNWTI